MTTLQTQVEEWMGTLKLNQMVIERQLDGLTHEDSMLDLPFRGNRLNWVLGHIAEHRDWMLRAANCTTLMPAKQAMIYRSGSNALTNNGDAVSIETLMNYLRNAKDYLLSRLESADENFLTEIPTTGILLESQREETRFQRLKGLVWHETYHLGQLELLRQLAGTNDAIL